MEDQETTSGVPTSEDRRQIQRRQVESLSDMSQARG